MLVVKDVFKSIQGEGSYIGTPAVFVRFAGCNVGCSWCDTDYSGGTAYHPHELVQLVLDKSPEAKHIVITGGEPLKQKQEDLFEFLMLLNTSLKSPIIQFETSTEGNAIDWILEASPRFHYARTNLNLFLTMSPKLFKDSFLESYDKGLKLAMGLRSPNLKAKGEFKIVVASIEELDLFCSLFKNLKEKALILNEVSYFIMFEQSFANNLVKTNSLQEVLNTYIEKYEKELEELKNG
jgi:organic radical activating enzyme